MIPRDPLRALRLPAPLSGARSRTAQGLTAAAAEGRFRLQVCGACDTACYPPRDACPQCLSADLPFRDIPPDGELVSETTIRIPGEVHFRERAPWRIGTVRLDRGPMVVAHLHGAVRQGQRVRLALVLDSAGAPAMVALPPRDPAPMEDRQMREFTCDPRDRRALVTDARTPVGQAMVRALVEAGAFVFAGVADAWMPFPGAETLAGDRIEIVPLDVTDSKSVSDLAAAIGARVEIVVNTAEHVRPGGVLATPVTVAQAAMERRALGLMRLAQGFGPILRARGAEGACAFVSLLAAHALMSWPAYGAHAAAEAATLSVSQCLRAELRPGGIRVLHVFAGPLETEWYQTVPPPKVAPSALARAVVAALRSGVEDVYVGDIAEDYRARLAANPKALERELS